MTKRWLAYPLLALVLGLAVFAATNPASADRPEDCAPEDREVPGNTNSDCRWDMGADHIATARYSVVENSAGNSCHEQLTFSPFKGTEEWEHLREVYVRYATVGEQGTPGRERVTSTLELGRIVATANAMQVRIGPSFTLDSSVPQSAGWQRETYYPDSIKPARYAVLKVLIDDNDDKYESVNRESKWLPMPANINDFSLLMNDCLAGIKQRLENEAKLEETRQRVEAERIAQERTAREAAAEAERQRLETDAAREALRIVRETELAKTQALIVQLEREKIIIGIWQEIVDEKLAGAKARAEVADTYLTEIEANAAAFRASVVAKAAEVRRLQDLNDAIAAAIIAHNDEIESQLAAQAEREAEQRKKLDDLHVEPPNETATPEPTDVSES